METVCLQGCWEQDVGGGPVLIFLCSTRHLLTNQPEVQVQVLSLLVSQLLSNKDVGPFCQSSCRLSVQDMCQCRIHALSTLQGQLETDSKLLISQWVLTLFTCVLLPHYIPDSSSPAAMQDPSSDAQVGDTFGMQPPGSLRKPPSLSGHFPINQSPVGPGPFVVCHHLWRDVCCQWRISRSRSTSGDGWDSTGASEGGDATWIPLSGQGIRLTKAPGSRKQWGRQP